MLRRLIILAVLLTLPGGVGAWEQVSTKASCCGTSCAQMQSSCCKISVPRRGPVALPAASVDLVSSLSTIEVPTLPDSLAFVSILRFEAGTKVAAGPPLYERYCSFLI